MSRLDNLVRPVASATAPWRVLTTAAEAEAIRADWDDLARRGATNELTRSPDWLLSWWKVFGGSQGRQLRLGLLHQAGRLIGLAPLLRRWYWHGPIPFQRLELLGSGEPETEGIYSNHLGILAEQGAEQHVADQLVHALADGAFGSWDELIFSMMAGTGPLPRHLVDAFQVRGWCVEQKEMARAPFIPLPSTWEAYLSSLSAAGRRSIQRSQKALDRWGENTTRLERVTDLNGLDRGKKLLIELHHARWTGAQHAGVFRSALYLSFHDAMMHQLAERGQLLLCWLSVRDEPIAVLYGMEWAGKVMAYQMGRRRDLPSHLRPGAVLLHLAIRQAIEAGRREFDLLADAVPYKLQLTDQSRPLLHLRVTRNSWRENARRFARKCLTGWRSLRSRRSVP